MNGGAYGAGKAGAPLDPFSILQRPQVILRLLCWVFSIVVFGCIGSEGWLKGKCLYNDDTNACNFGIGIGVIAFLGSIGLLVLEAMFDNISSIKVRRRAVIGDLAFSAGMTFLWFVSFCYLSDSWRKSPYPRHGYGVNNMRAAIAFSFFSIFIWEATYGEFSSRLSFVTHTVHGHLNTVFQQTSSALLGVSTIVDAAGINFWTIPEECRGYLPKYWSKGEAGCIVFAFRRYRQGSDTAFAPSYEAEPHGVPGGAPYTSYPDGPEMNEGYQEPPFSATKSDIPAGGTNFQQPAY